MISNLANYNDWKRGTLDRVTNKHNAEMLKLFATHLRSLKPVMAQALDAGMTTFHFDEVVIAAQLEKILNRHLRDTVYVAVSDGMREVSPDKKLSTWINWPVWYPVEKTFVELAERKQRDSIFKFTVDKVSKLNRKNIADIIQIEKQRYLKNIKSIFGQLAEEYYGGRDESTTAEVVKDVIARIFDKTKSQTERIFRTETTRYFNDARIAYFNENTDVDFVQLMAITDGRISNICESRDKYVIPLAQAGNKKFKPPFHPNCRTIQSPLVTYLKSNADKVRNNLGSEFGLVHSDTSDKDFQGQRAPPAVSLPVGWA